MRHCNDTKPELCHYYNLALSVCDMPMEERCWCSEVVEDEKTMKEEILIRYQIIIDGKFTYTSFTFQRENHSPKRWFDLTKDERDCIVKKELDIEWNGKYPIHILEVRPKIIEPYA